MPLVGVAGIAGAPAPLRALTRPRPLERPPRSCALMGAAPLAGRDSGPPAGLLPASGPAACATLRPEVCPAPAGVFRHSGAAAVQ